MTDENVVENLFKKALDEKPTFTDAMLKHMEQEVEKITEEARKWHLANKGKSLSFTAEDIEAEATTEEGVE